MRFPDSYLVFDFETTGLSPHADRIIQMGFCRVENEAVVERGGWLVCQEARIHPEAQARHGISQGDLKARGVGPAEGLARLLAHLNSAPACVGHNIHNFDIPFLLAECGRSRLSAPVCNEYIDTAAIYKGWKLGLGKAPKETHQGYAQRVLSTRAPGLKFSIPECLRVLGIPADQSGFHDASHDAFLTHLIFRALGTRL